MSGDVFFSTTVLTTCSLDKVVKSQNNQLNKDKIFRLQSKKLFNNASYFLYVRCN